MSSVAPKGPGAGSGRLPRPTAGIPARRLGAGMALVVLGLPLLTAALVPLRSTVALPSDLLLYLLAVVVIAAVGGVLPAVLAAVAASLLLNYWFTPPYHTLTIAQRDHVFALVVFVTVAVTVSVTVEVAARLRSQAARSAAEAATLSRLATGPLAEQSLPAVLEQMRTTFGMAAAALVRPGPDGRWVAVATAGAERDWSSGQGQIAAPVGEGLRLVASGPPPFAEDRRLLGAYAAAAARALEAEELAQQAARARELAAIDALRASLLAAVGHDLRTPLAGIKAAVSSLRQQDVAWTAEESRELLATVEESADRLTNLVANLLDMSRLQAGVLSVDPRPVALDEIVLAAVLSLPRAGVEVVVPEKLPLVCADPGLFERVLVNLVENALRYSPPDRPVTVTAQATATAAYVSVVDHGPGVRGEDLDRMFTPFQRLGDRAVGGVGLGLAIARGFSEAMGGSLTPSPTPGGGLRMTITLPVVRQATGPPRPGP